MRMKCVTGWVLIAAALLAVMPGTAEAQGFGVKGGVATATLRDNFELTTNIVGFKGARRFAGGIFFGVGLAAGLSLQPEVLYQQRRADVEVVGIVDPEAGSWIEATYIEVPLLLKWQTGGTGPAVFAGPSMAFRMNAKSVDKLGDTIDETDLKEITNGTDFGVVMGAGINFGKFGLEARYTASLKSFNKDETGNTLKWATWNLFASIAF
jgi:hypothetical protein